MGRFPHPRYAVGNPRLGRALVEPANVGGDAGLFEFDHEPTLVDPTPFVRVRVEVDTQSLSLEGVL